MASRQIMREFRQQKHSVSLDLKRLLSSPCKPCQEPPGLTTSVCNRTRFKCHYLSLDRIPSVVSRKYRSSFSIFSFSLDIGRYFFRQRDSFIFCLGLKSRRRHSQLHLSSQFIIRSNTSDRDRSLV